MLILPPFKPNLQMTYRIAFLLIASWMSFSSQAQEPIGFLDQSSALNDWDLQNNEQGGSPFKLKPYKGIYILPLHHSTAINHTPYSENPRNSFSETTGMVPTEIKFQLSFKMRALHDLFGDRWGGDLWLAFTQTSRFQQYNPDWSRPFRDSNYEPELIFLMPTPYRLGALEGLYSALVFNHQSNGREIPYSRSWNRVILHLGFQTGEWNWVLAPWWRIPEENWNDDNPEISNYVGRAELTARYSKGRHQLSVTGRHSLRSDENNRGSLRLEYNYRTYGSLQLHLQLFSGYGESLIDYNHFQNTLGLGISML